MVCGVTELDMTGQLSLSLSCPTMRSLFTYDAWPGWPLCGLQAKSERKMPSDTLASDALQHKWLGAVWFFRTLASLWEEALEQEASRGADV